LKLIDYLQVLQEREEQEAQLLDELTSRLLPPPIPKEEKILVTSKLPQAGQLTSFSPPILVKHSNLFPHCRQINS